MISYFRSGCGIRNADCESSAFRIVCISHCVNGFIDLKTSKNLRYGKYAVVRHCKLWTRKVSRNFRMMMLNHWHIYNRAHNPAVKLRYFLGPPKISMRQVGANPELRNLKKGRSAYDP